MGTLTIANFDLTVGRNGRGMIVAKAAPPSPIA